VGGRFSTLKTDYPHSEHTDTIEQSGAIIDYVIDKYDPDAILHYTSEPEKYQQRSWEHFQMSGQGPYLGQRMWFDRYHAEFYPSAVERYTNEAKRVVGVIDAHLKKKGTDFLVGDKPCFADFMLVPWFSSLTAAVIPGLDTSGWPYYSAWLARLYASEGTAKALAKHIEASKEWKPAPSRSAAQN
jgi:glutathione S-transferase